MRSARSRDSAEILPQADRGSLPAHSRNSDALRSCRGIPQLLARLRDPLGMTNRSFGFFHYVSQIGWTRAAAHLASEDRRWSGGNKLVPLQNELRINSVARRLIHFVATEVAVELVFVIVIATEFETF